VTPEGLIKRGYRFARFQADAPLWVHPSGREVILLSSPRRGPPQPKEEEQKKKNEEEKKEEELQTKCVDPCTFETDDEEKCNECCEERIPESDVKCRRACGIGCSLKL
jgi:hypothetical protein